MVRRMRQTPLILLALLFACGTPPTAIDSGTSFDAGTGGGGGVASGGGGGAAAGGGAQATFIDGGLGGRPFGPVLGGWFIGHPDAPQTTVIYLFDRFVDCHDATVRFGTLGWDLRLPMPTSFLELKPVGPRPVQAPPTPAGDYVITMSMTPASGEAVVNHSAVSAGAANEVFATSGVVTVQSISAADVSGRFTAVFPAGSLQGSFSVGFCDVGVEP